MKTNCSIHGKNATSTICGHLVNNKNESLGFVENSAIKGDFQGWCYACEYLFLKEKDITESFKSYLKGIAERYDVHGLFEMFDTGVIWEGSMK